MGFDLFVFGDIWAVLAMLLWLSALAGAISSRLVARPQILVQLSDELNHMKYRSSRSLKAFDYWLREHIGNVPPLTLADAATRHNETVYCIA